MAELYRVGVISDTHGLLRPTALTALQGVDLIIHAGDIGKPEVLAGLEQIAPVRAVRGNNDRGNLATALPDRLTIEVGSRRIYLLHNLKELEIDPKTAGYHAVIAGHSHKPFIEWRDGLLYLNPGAAGPRRFKLPISLARLEIRGDEIKPTLIELPEISKMAQNN